MADAEVRTAIAADAAEIARIQLGTWRSAYSELLPPGVLDELTEDTAEQQWREAIEENSTTVLLATEGDWSVGFCAGGTAPTGETAAADGSVPEDANSTVLVSTLLVEPRWGRRGHGGRLLGTLAQQLRQAGNTRGISWIPEADEASMAFYRGVGWEPDGTVRTLDAGGRPLRELRVTGTLELRFQ
ncbi:Acetyltransferase (GNAT) domain-containing protein [Actinopolyspora xinjiangensis]|uniref:Acetyltransferase (GNAT) domain-containing protein n=1 Tax=Actinopolyspora xinjiangensis TaxID=405564 RepID=A0A1H0SUK3_9ACTN|nr:GNAT family N-acetyltransferase [Actinopolyspora xinjiangensis]SDP45391.1 Acetyltransferase (GNAT) domain-containing protein [Actinopolyspora xinjiangensis]